MSRRDHQRLAAGIWLGVAVVLAVIFVIVARGYSYEVARQRFVIRAVGYAALGALFCALLSTPAKRVLGRLAPNLARGRVDAFRRAAGINAAIFGTIHAGLVLSVYLPPPLWRALQRQSFLRAGLLALLVLLLLWATSYPWWVKTFRVKLWKQLHRLSYVAALLVFQHLMLSTFGNRWVGLLLFAGLAGLWCLRFLPGAARS